MKATQFPFSTLKEVPADAEIVSHQLMLRAGLIRKLTSGLYTWKPWGLKILRKVEQIVREEMDAAGAIECLMPTLQPAELWRESGRWEAFGPQLLTLTDRHDREYCYGPTNEEVITDYVRNEVHSYKQLPLNLYQIQLKFRDEIRPRFGVMRAREFLMKDAYSFHMDADSLDTTFQAMYDAYSRIFSRLGLAFRAVEADSGAIGGNASMEFHVLAESGEDAIAWAADGDYAANIEKAEAIRVGERQPASGKAMSKVETPAQRSIDEVAKFLSVEPDQCIKTLLMKGSETPVVAVLLRGDHELNEVKAAKHPALAEPLTLASHEEVAAASGCEAGFVGPVGLEIPVIADHAASLLSDFVCGANESGYHLRDVNFGTDLPEPECADLRNVVAGDPSPDGNGTLDIVRGIEVGHIFKLGTKYSEAMNCQVLDEAGKSQVLTMGCYGIGVTRIVAAAIEQNNDERGIIWPNAMAPFQLAIAPINLHKSERLRSAVEALYTDLKRAGIDVFLDDRKVRPGVMFADLELLGIPHRIVFSEKGLDAGELEYKHRTASATEQIPLDNAVEHILAKIQESKNV